MRAGLVNYVEPITTITAEIEPLDHDGTRRVVDLRWTGEDYEAVIEDLPPGPYHLTVIPGPSFPAPAPPVRDLFEVVP